LFYNKSKKKTAKKQLIVFKFHIKSYFYRISSLPLILNFTNLDFT